MSSAAYRLREFWENLAIRKKFYVIIGVTGLVVAAAMVANLFIIRYAIDSTHVIMDDNLLCHELQDSLAAVAEKFDEFQQERNEENETAYRQALEAAECCLARLPYDYGKVGEGRYALTWNIINSYGVYEKQLEKLVGMSAREQEYMRELYEAYDMADYLNLHVSKLSSIALTQGNEQYRAAMDTLSRFPAFLLVVGIAAFGMLWFLLRAVVGKIVNGVSGLSRATLEMEDSHFTSPDVVWEGKDEIGQLIHAFNKMKRAAADYLTSLEEKRLMEEQLHRQELEREELEQKFSMAQLQLIKNQLNPHFLFNTLNMITRMAQMEDASVTEEMLVAMSNLLRYSLRTTEPFVPLGQELKVTEDYMYIQKMRFGSRISWEIDCPKELYEEMVPVFLLQPLAENAVVHGLAEKEEGGFLGIRVWKENGLFRLEVKDTGAGICPERLLEIREAMKKRGKGVGIGLGNIFRRIAVYYEDGSVSVDSVEGEGTTILIEFGKRK